MEPVFSGSGTFFHGDLRAVLRAGVARNVVEIEFRGWE